MTLVLDACAIIAYLRDEDGAEVVESVLLGVTIVLLMSSIYAKSTTIVSEERARHRQTNCLRILLLLGLSLAMI
jgi:uncharacterized protein with PIN domain